MLWSAKDSPSTAAALTSRVVCSPSVALNRLSFSSSILVMLSNVCCSSLPNRHISQVSYDSARYVLVFLIPTPPPPPPFLCTLVTFDCTRIWSKVTHVHKGMRLESGSQYDAGSNITYVTVRAVVVSTLEVSEVAFLSSNLIGQTLCWLCWNRT